MKAALSICFAIVLSSTAMAATYEVPVEKELEPFATFELAQFEKTIDGDQISVKYLLPELLTGSNTTIEMTGKFAEGSEKFTLKGSQSVAECEGIEKTECTIHYSSVYIDSVKAALAIQKISKSEEEVGLRLKVMRSFSTDPVGFIYY